MKSKMDHRSPSRFSTGVPVSAKREPAFSILALRVCLALGFLMACASSKTASRQDVSVSQGIPQKGPLAGITYAHVPGGPRGFFFVALFGISHRRPTKTPRRGGE